MSPSTMRGHQRSVALWWISGSVALTACATPSTAAERTAGVPLPAALPLNSEDEGRARYEQGVRLRGMASPDYNGALVEFERAYELLGGHPRRYRSLFNIATCYQELRLYDLAIEYYARYLQEGGTADPDHEQAERTIEVLRERIGTLEVTTNVPDAELWINGRCVQVRSEQTQSANIDRCVRVREGRLRVAAGHHMVEARAPGHLPERKSVEVGASQEVALRFQLVPVSSGTPRWLFWLSVASSVSFAGLTVGLYTAAFTDWQEVQSRIHSSNELERGSVDERDQRRINALAIAGDVSLGLTLALSATSVVLGFTTRWPSVTPGSARRVSLLGLPTLRGDGGSVIFQGTF